MIAGAGPAAFTAREGALKLREGARVMAEGHDIEYLLHGSAVPLDVATPCSASRRPTRTASSRRSRPRPRPRGSRSTVLGEPAPLPMLLAQIPLTVRLQLLALRFALERGQDPDTVITGNWADERPLAVRSPRPVVRRENTSLRRSTHP